MFFVTIAFGGMFIVSALDYRFMWSDVPLYAVIAGDILVAVGFFIVFLVYKENTFTSATIEVDKEQKVISTGPYALVRHPMYSGGLLMLLATPPALGSWWGLLSFIPPRFSSSGGFWMRRNSLRRICPAISSISKKFDQD